jgi:hypothetical protein
MSASGALTGDGSSPLGISSKYVRASSNARLASMSPAIVSDALPGW